MLRNAAKVRTVAREISAAADSAFEAYTGHRVEEEPQITDRILGAIEDRISDRVFNGVIWRARTLRTGRGIAAEEKRHGADLMGVLDIRLPDYKTKKGFLGVCAVERQDTRADGRAGTMRGWAGAPECAMAHRALEGDRGVRQDARRE